MITGLDHLVLITRDIDAGVAAYEALFGRPPLGRSEHAGAANAFFALGNCGLELIAPSGEGPMADRAHQEPSDHQ